MTKDEALKLALEALERLQGGCTDSDDGTIEAITVWCPEVITAINKALAQPEPVQVSPLDFVTMTLEKEHWVGRPIIWAQWPNEEKNT